MTGIVKTDQIQGAGSSTVTIPSGTALNVTTVSGTPTFSGASTFSGDVTLPSINGGQIGGRRNVFINGAMQVFQRSTSESSLGGSTGYFTADRIRFKPNSTAGRFTSTKDSSAPNGFANSLKLDCTTADTSIGAGEYFFLSQKIEGQDLQHFAKGTSDAKPFTVSFYVKGNASATYTCELFDEDNTRQISKTFSVTTNWTRVELLFPADTTGAFDNDTSSSMTFAIWLHAGTNYTSGTLNSSSWASATTANRVSSSNTSFFDSTDRTFFLTGLQLETSSIVTPFEHKTFAEELTLCRRYYQRYGYPFTAFRNSTTYTWVDATIWFLCLPFDADDCVGSHALPVEMRAIPTASMTDAYIRLQNNGQNYNSGNTLQVNGSSTSHASLHIDTSAGLNATNVIAFTFNNANGYYDLSAEL